jgi:hypothetical protein
MASTMTFPDRFGMTVALKPATDAAGRTGDYVRISEAHRAYLVVIINQGASNTVQVSLSKATAAAGSGATAVTETLRIWAAQDVETTNVLAAQTAAASFTTSATTTVKQIVFEINPGELGATYDFVAPVTGASSASNITAAYVITEPFVAFAGGDNLMVD